MSIIPCRNCGGELYDSVRKYHLAEACAAEGRCYDFDHYTKGSYCPHCDATVGGDPSDAAIVAERHALFSEADGLASGLAEPSLEPNRT